MQVLNVVVGIDRLSRPQSGIHKMGHDGSGRDSGHRECDPEGAFGCSAHYHFVLNSSEWRNKRMSDDTISGARTTFASCVRARGSARFHPIAQRAATSAGNAELSNTLFTKRGQYGQPAEGALIAFLLTASPAPTKGLRSRSGETTIAFVSQPSLPNSHSLTRGPRFGATEFLRRLSQAVAGSDTHS